MSLLIGGAVPRARAARVEASMSGYVDAASARPIVDARRRGVDEFMRGVK